MTSTSTPTKAQEILRKRSTKELIRDFLATNLINDPDIYTVRGWIMDELERRDPEAYAAWIDGPGRDEDLEQYFKA